MAETRWDHYRALLWSDRDLEMMLDVSRTLSGGALTDLQSVLAQAIDGLLEIEAGVIANPDEGRRVGHYWLRQPELAPDPEIRRAITDTIDQVKRFVSGKGKPGGFTDFLLIGIGGSALGPQFVADALGGSKGLRPHFIDNTDPDGIDRVLQDIGGRLSSTLTIVISKSGGTRETRNGMLEVMAAYERAGLDFGSRAVAVTGKGSALENTAKEEGFLEVFPMWDWVGGRTSVLSAVGLLPAALQGIDIEELLAGARDMDAQTRLRDVARNPAALLAAAWHVAGDGRGDRDMVVLPYKDRLLLLSRYLQQLVMESLGKELDLDGNPVHQGIVVYGNKGSTDQHAYVQQLRDGPDNFFATFIEVLEDRSGPSLDVDGGATAGDYLLGFLLGTREALTERGRSSVTITIPGVSPRSVGALIALYERAVGIYAGLVNINAYHQPGVEAGKKAAGQVLELQARALAALRSNLEREWSIDEVAKETGGDPEILFKILEHAAANLDHGIVVRRGEHPTENRYRAS